MRIDKINEYKITVYGQPATKKNSSVMIARRAAILPSKAYREYAKVFRLHLMKARNLPHFLGPVALEVKYYLKNRAHYPDLNGLIQATQDLISDEYVLMPDKATGKRKKQLAKKWLLADDRLVKSLDGCRIAGIDKENPRAEITLRALDVDLKTETDPQIKKICQELASKNQAI